MTQDSKLLWTDPFCSLIAPFRKRIIFAAISLRWMMQIALRRALIPQLMWLKAADTVNLVTVSSRLGKIPVHEVGFTSTGNLPWSKPITTPCAKVYVLGLSGSGFILCWRRLCFTCVCIPPSLPPPVLCAWICALYATPLLSCAMSTRHACKYVCEDFSDPNVKKK